MNIYYIDYKKSDTGEHTLHKKGCMLMPKVDSCLLLGEFYSTDNLYSYASDQFPQWMIKRCSCCL